MSQRIEEAFSRLKQIMHLVQAIERGSIEPQLGDAMIRELQREKVSLWLAR